MLSFNQFLLVKLAEECNEVGQRALKQVQFGKDESQATNPVNQAPGKVFTDEQKLNNTQRLRGEVNDLLCILDFLTDVEELPPIADSEYDAAREAKWAKIQKYLASSRELEQVEP